LGHTWELDVTESSARGLPPVDISSFFISLAQSALVHLGEVADPSTGQRTPELTVARYTIDTLAMLEEKTKGNLDEQEAKLVDSLLYELRSKFVEVSTRTP
jgi:hypothetical protein